MGPNGPNEAKQCQTGPNGAKQGQTQPAIAKQGQPGPNTAVGLNVAKRRQMRQNMVLQLVAVMQMTRTMLQLLFPPLFLTQVAALQLVANQVSGVSGLK